MNPESHVFLFRGEEIKVEDLSPLKQSYRFPGFGFDSGPNLQPWKSVFFVLPRYLCKDCW